ncbi:hypothetical protein A4X13_0g8718 [Tilletia indica]|uniref:Thiamin pyrophosphokinase thiamin-binding domain-containing protein n=1 Tax=Tilletia indica TaxID=43049 RepID=A0A177T1J7_9BASI|nr:hypothetical protein A4X13_0g8718 [Tilletia indica]
MMSSNNDISAEVKIWDASHLFNAGSGHSAPKPDYAIILLNAPISVPQQDIFLSLWTRARHRLCADGGANRLLDAFGEEALVNSTVPLPHEIRGDLDSLREDTRAFFEKLQVRITKRDSQNATDLQKCIKAVEMLEQEELKQGRITEPLELVIYGGLSGRFDQTVHTLHVLWTLGAPIPQDQSGTGSRSEKDEDGTISRRGKTWVVGEQCLVWILEPGRHIIHASSPPLGPTCGLLPLATSSGARIISKGLRWNLDGTIPSSLPSFLSTSNQIPFSEGKATIEVETDKTIYWSIELQESK